MSIPVGSTKTTKPKKLSLQIDKFDGGVNTLVSSSRLKKNEAVQATNLMLVEDGLWGKAWGTAYYGTDAGGAIVDGWTEFRKSDGTRELIVFGNGLAKKSTNNGSTWATISGYTPTTGTPVNCIQLGDFLYACNGTDALARYNGTAFYTYTALAAPTNLAGSLTGISSGNYHYYYVVTAHNEIGETIASDEIDKAVNEDRDLWSSTDKIALTWTAVAGATSYSVYMGEASGYYDWITDIGTNQFDDTGQSNFSPNPYREPQSDNTTGGPKFSQMFVSDNRLWGVDDPNNPWTAYFSGKGSRTGLFSFTKGGGWIELEKGSKFTTNCGVDFQNKAHVFCPAPSGRGTIWAIALSYNSTWNFFDPTATKVTNQIACYAPRGVVQVENDVFFITKKGVFVLGNEPNITSDTLRTNELSAKIRDYVQAITDTNLQLVTAFYKDGKVFFSTPTKTFYYDRERMCWVKDWGFGSSQLGEYTDTNNVTRFLGGMSTDGYLFEISVNHQGFLGTAFSTKYLSPRFPADSNWIKFAKIKRAYVRLKNAQGSINFTVNGTQKSAAYSSLVSETISPGYSDSGLGWDQLGVCQLGTSLGTPTTFQEESLIRYAKVNKKLRDIQFEISTTGISDQYVLSGLIAEGFPLDIAPPSSWKIS